MKKILIITFVIFSTGCGYKRIADLTVVANRNIKYNLNDYSLIERNVSAKCRIKKNDALETALDKAVESKGGDYMMNCKIYISKTGNKIKVTGDVYGENLNNLTNK